MHGVGSIQDLMQNVYIRLHTHFEEVRTLENPTGWLLRVAENVCHDEFRRLIRAQNVRERFFRYDVHRDERDRQQLELSLIHI